MASNLINSIDPVNNLRFNFTQEVKITYQQEHFTISVITYTQETIQ